MITGKTFKALSILRDNPEVTANRFAYLYYSGTEKEYLLTAVSNQGNGACAGKKSWLCAGSFLAKLVKKGYVNRKRNIGPTRFSITEKGQKELKETEELLSTFKQ